MQKSFEARPFRYLLKPTSFEEFENAFLSAYKYVLNMTRKYIEYQYKKKFYKIPIQNVLYFESRKRKIMIVTPNFIGTMYAKLSEMEDVLKQNVEYFVRVHQSFLVNYLHIQVHANQYIIMDNGIVIPISEEKRKSVRKDLQNSKDVVYIN